MELEHNSGHPRRWTILSVLVISVIVVVLDNTVLNVAMRLIADPVRGIGASQADLEWAINSYTLAFAGLLFTAGVLGDRFGRRRLLLIGLAVFGLASLAAAYSHSPSQLLMARALLGVGAAAVMPATLAIVSNVFDPRERAKAIGLWSAAVGVGVAIGPVVGGALLEKFWWGSVFLINVPIIVFGLVVVWLIVPESRNPAPGRPDVVGVVISVVGLVALVFGIIHGGEHGFGRPLAWTSIVVGLTVLAVFVWYERRTDHPSLDVRLFRDPRFATAVGSVGLLFFAALGTMFFLAFYLQLVRGYTPLHAGLLMTPFAAAQLIFGPQSAAMLRRFGPKVVCAAGLSLVALAQWGFTVVGLVTPIWVLIVITFVQGTGMAIMMPAATESVMSSLPREKAGVGSAIQNTVRQVGGALGVAVLGSVLASVYRVGVADNVAALAPQVRTAAAESISGAYGVADQLGPTGADLISSANEAFVAAMHWAAGGSAVVATVSIVVVLVWLPRHSAPMPALPADAAEPPAPVGRGAGAAEPPAPVGRGALPGADATMPAGRVAVGEPMRLVKGP